MNTRLKPRNTSRAEFLNLPLAERRKIMSEQADTLKDYYDTIAKDEYAEFRRPMRPYALGFAVAALDKLACALADHGHKWTSDERESYEEAIKLLTWKDDIKK